MAWTDPITTLKTLLDTITIPPQSLGSITKLVTIGKVDASARGGPSGEITPQYTLTVPSMPGRSIDSNGVLREIRMIVQVDVWCQTYGPTENSYQLKEKMTEQLRRLIQTNRANPSTTIKFMEIINETDRDEADIQPILRRKLVLIECTCFRV